MECVGVSLWPLHAFLALRLCACGGTEICQHLPPRGDAASLETARESANQPPATDVSRRQTNVCSPAQQLLQLGVTPQTAYLYMRGHDLLDGVVMPLMTSICDMLRRQREREISKLACHAVQKRNELAAYQHAIAPFEAMVRKQTAITIQRLLHGLWMRRECL